MLWVVIASVWMFGPVLVLIAVWCIGETLVDRAARRRARDLPREYYAEIFDFPNKEIPPRRMNGRRGDYSH